MTDQRDARIAELEAKLLEQGYRLEDAIKHLSAIEGLYQASVEATNAACAERDKWRADWNESLDRWAKENGELRFRLDSAVAMLRRWVYEDDDELVTFIRMEAQSWIESAVVEKQRHLTVSEQEGMHRALRESVTVERDVSDP